MPSPVRDAGPTSTDTTSPNFTDGQKKSLYSSLSPHIREPFSPLSELATRALRRYGDMSPGTVDGAVMELLLDFSHDIIEDLRAHPYFTNLDIDYYKQQDECREIPDPIVVTGLLAYYAEQQGSKKAEMLMAKYRHTMSSILYNRKYGHEKIEFQAVDKTDLTKVEQTNKVDPSEQWK